MAASTSFISRASDQLRTPTGKIVIVALVSTGLTAATILSTQAVRRRTRRSRLRDEIEETVQEQKIGAGEEEELTDFTGASTSQQSNGKRVNASTTSSAENAFESNSNPKRKPTNEIIIREALARNFVFFGEEGMKKIRNSFVIVVGVGGVGSAAATMLVRSGIGKIRLIDFDQVSLSSLNRHATATLAQVGTPKVTSCAESFAETAPWVEIDPRIELFSKEAADDLLAGNPDYVIDCIDNIDSKSDLLIYCHKRKIPVFSSLGAGAKSDPSRIQVSDISTTFEDPLARVIRRRLRIEGVMKGIPVVYSTEKPRADIGLIPLPEEEFQKGKVEELSAIAKFRVRILPVLGPLPAMFGNAAAAYVLQDLAKFPMEPLPVKNRQKMAASLHRQLTAYMTKSEGLTRLPFSEEDVLYLFEEVHRAKSVVYPFEFPARPCLLPWEKSKGLQFDNLVIFDREDGNKHEKECLEAGRGPEQVWGKETAERVANRAEEEKRLSRYRI